MSKTFYDHQEQAQENSVLLLTVLAIAIGLTTLFTALAATLWLFVPLYYFYISAFPRPETMLTIHMHPDRYHPVQLWLVEHFPWMAEFPWELFAFFYVVILVAVGSGIIIATRNKLRQLWAAGGVGVADTLGGVCITKEGYRRDKKTQQLVNVVNEIAIASRMPPPHVYMLHDEPGINAFAVGLTARDMVIGATAGAVAELNREQMQSVIAHEFAHIKNGDTRTNVLLIGYLHGLMTIIIAAQSLIHKGVEMAVNSISHGGFGAIGIPTTLMGAMLWPVGLVGLCFATLIKAAYARQREFLADASAIEYTRNDVGLVMAMKRILGAKFGSRIRSPRCLALSHVFFAKSCGGVMGFLDSHPPIEKRIRRVDTNWDGEVAYEEEHDVGKFEGVFRGTMSIAQKARETSSGRLHAASGIDADFSMLQINDPVVMGVNEHAAMIQAAVAPQLWALTQQIPSAEAMVFALWSIGQCHNTKEDNAELSALGDSCEASKKVAEALKPHVETCGLSQRLMLFDAAINTLRQAAQEGCMKSFCEKAESFLKTSAADDDLFRWAWRKTVEELVNRELELPRPQPKFRDVDEVLDECQVILSAIAHGSENEPMAGYALMRAGNALGHDFELLSEDEADLDAVERSLERLQQLAPKARQKLVLASSASVDTDERMSDREALLMRGICSGLGYPPATLLPGQPLRK